MPTSGFKIWINLPRNLACCTPLGGLSARRIQRVMGPLRAWTMQRGPITRTGALWPSTLVPAASYWPEMTGDPFFFSSGALKGFLLKPLRARMKLLLLEPESYPSLQQRTLKLLPRGAVHIVDAFAPKGR